MFCRVKNILLIAFLAGFAVVAFAQGKVLPRPELLAKYKTLLGTASDQISKMKKMEDDAREQNDMVVVNCIHPKYVTARRLLEIAKKSYDRLQTLGARGGEGVSVEVINSITRKIKLACDRIADLYRAAQSCLSISAAKAITKVKILQGQELLPGKKEIGITTEIPAKVETPPPSGSE